MTQANATYSLCCDLNGDGDFSDASEDISAYWMSMQTIHGVINPMDAMGRSSTLIVKLKNDGQLFSLEHANALSGFRRGRAIRLTMTYSAITVTKFIGVIDHIKPTPGDNGPRTCEVRCDGYFVRLQQEPVRIPLMENCYSGAVIQKIFDGVRSPIPSVPGWLAGITGRSEAGTSTIAAGVPLTIDAGKQFFSFIGDNWQDGQKAYGALREVVDTERGLLYEEPDGGVTYLDREFFVRDLASALDGTYDGTYVGPSSVYKHSEDLISGVEISYNPRRLDSDISVLATSDENITVNYWTSNTRRNMTKLSLYFRDENGRKLGGKNIIPPVPGKDFKAFFDGSNLPTATKRIKIDTVIYSDHVDLTFNIPKGPERRAYVTGLQIRGQRYRDRGQQQVTATNETALADYQNPKVMQLNLPLIQTRSSANDLANYLLGQFSLPKGIFERISFYANRDAAHMAEALNRKIGDRVSLTEGQTGDAGEYWIVGIQHNIRHANAHQVTYILRPGPAYTHWLAGVANYSEAGTSTRAG